MQEKHAIHFILSSQSCKHLIGSSVKEEEKEKKKKRSSAEEAELLRAHRQTRRILL